MPPLWRCEGRGSLDIARAAAQTNRIQPGAAVSSDGAHPRSHGSIGMSAIDPRIVGIWQLKGTLGRDDAGKVLEAPYGPKAMGLVTFQADGRMMAVLCDGRAALGGEPRQFMSYAGNYT